MTITNAIIFRINSLLDEHHMTKRQLARKAHIPESTVSSIFRCISKGVSLNTVCAIAKGFNMSMAEFLDDEVFANLDV
jgi:transcriptional regulator with XRE-family HTH domain